MMMALVDWDTFLLGLLTGTLASLLFFAGLAAGMHLALKRDHPTALLLSSAILRIALLLWLGTRVATMGIAAIIGFALAFMLTRFIITLLVRPRKTRETA
jgi:hypothetical protein